ncbi:hypothetical protein GCM10022243_14260 [Saccharothrix violaceirubra]|uniref:Acyl-CoA hydrolase n=1 Tax=Saccharothrix violaceirubra TaxID=413306 RepID=A0A7W7T6L6_9PSEU|nr:LUD domain-containing protein [Saccharothrix violaceirubra]MBB4967301.1 acyl-CoA hydrolase [Saccharothrix violaceirubra]
MSTPDFAAPASADRVDHVAEAARGNGLTVDVVDTVADARRLLNDTLPTDKTIFTAASETLRLSGIAEDVDESGRFRSVRAALRERNADRDPEQVRLEAVTPDVVLGSVHAVTEQGHLVIASATGSQLAPYAYGAASVVWVVGAQKVVPDLETALHRVRTYTLAKENERCLAVYGQPSVLSKILIVERELFPGRARLVLVREAIGF